MKKAKHMNLFIKKGLNFMSEHVKISHNMDYYKKEDVMFRKITFMMLLILSVFVISACGQGESSVNTTAQTNDSNSNQNENVSGNNNSDSKAEDIVDNKKEKQSIELYFSDELVEQNFRIVKEIEASEDNLFVKTLEEWVKGPNHDQLASLIPETVKVLSVEIEDSTAFVSFSSEFLDATVGSGVEELLLQQIALVMNQFGFNQTQILIEGQIVDELFGHFVTTEPIEAENPLEIETIY